MGRASPPSSQCLYQKVDGLWFIARITTLYASLYHLRDATVSSTTPNLSLSVRERPEMSYVAPQTSILELS